MIKPGLMPPELLLSKESVLIFVPTINRCNYLGEGKCGRNAAMLLSFIYRTPSTMAISTFSKFSLLPEDDSQHRLEAKNG